MSKCGQCWSWGRNFWGQVGNGNRQDHPFPVHIKLNDNDYPTTVVAVAAGKSHSVALTNDGRVNNNLINM